ncbi:MAG: hypothetical protein RIR49_1983, partial [Actinomycetota bacterium]
MGLDTSTDRSSTGGSDHDDRTVFRPWPVPPGRGRDHDPRSAYVERFWISTLGPSATWIMRRLADEFDANPDGFVIDVSE